MNFVRMYEFGLISFEELKEELWNFGPNSICAIGENCFKFYIAKALGYHTLEYYVEELFMNEIINRNCIKDKNNQDDPYADIL